VPDLIFESLGRAESAVQAWQATHRHELERRREQERYRGLLRTVMPPRIPLQMGLNWLAHTGWASIFCDGAHEVLLVHQQTGAVRDAPWIALRTRDGCIYFANLLTRETRWLPPHLWMHGWVSRTGTCTSSDLRRSRMSRVLDRGGRDLPCDGRKPLPPSVAFQRVEGGAPYMYEPTHGTPQYPPDERWDSQLTYPLEGNYVRWPLACPMCQHPLTTIYR
jgi:hypothetical protein